MRPWRTVTGAIGGLTLFSEDITERVMARRLKAESEERLMLALESSNAGVWLLDLAATCRSPTSARTVSSDSPAASARHSPMSWLSCIDDRDRLQARLEEMPTRLATTSGTSSFACCIRMVQCGSCTAADVQTVTLPD